MHELNAIKDHVPDSGLARQIDEASRVGQQDLLQLDNQLNLPSH